MLWLLLFSFFTFRESKGYANLRKPPVIPGLPSIGKLALNGGYVATNYEVITEDGYSLWLHRIGNNSGPPVLMQHGLFVAADSWITRGSSKKDLAFMLLDLGYDVWLSNQRGTFFNQYSLKYPKTDPRFWNFSFHESGYYDIPAFVDKILAVRKVEQLFFIGHSFGTVTYSVMCATRPEYNAKIKAAVLMSPVIYQRLGNQTSSALEALATVRDFVTTNVFSRSSSIEVGTRSAASVQALKVLCGNKALTQEICLTIFGLFVGENRKNLNIDDWSTFVLYASSTSLRTLIHAAQNRLADQFQQFDFGPAENLMRYNSLKPPKYRLDLVTAPTALFWSLNDPTLSEQSVGRYASKIANIITNAVVDDPKFSHADMIIGDNVNVVLNPRIIEILDSFSQDGGDAEELIIEERVGRERSIKKKT
ncbi:lipase 1 [Halyomorpha halys]|uniref:lipase 1 n=1 Tax=Halyomorpha halys TaxID=286706 RepID=UPI0006D4F78B|nr:lipase 1 [Halyomorpha halys]